MRLGWRGGVGLLRLGLGYGVRFKRPPSEARRWNSPLDRELSGSGLG